MRRLGIQWGNDIGLLGFDELEWAELAGVGITTLKQPTYQMGHALERLVQRISAFGCPSGEQMFSGELIVRGPPPANPPSPGRCPPRPHRLFAQLRDCDHIFTLCRFPLEPVPFNVPVAAAATMPPQESK